MKRPALTTLLFCLMLPGVAQANMNTANGLAWQWQGYQTTQSQWLIGESIQQAALTTSVPDDLKAFEEVATIHKGQWLVGENLANRSSIEVATLGHHPFSLQQILLP